MKGRGQSPSATSVIDGSRISKYSRGHFDRGVCMEMLYKTCSMLIVLELHGAGCHFGHSLNPTVSSLGSQPEGGGIPPPSP